MRFLYSVTMHYLSYSENVLSNCKAVQSQVNRTYLADSSFVALAKIEVLTWLCAS